MQDRFIEALQLCWQVCIKPRETMREVLDRDEKFLQYELLIAFIVLSAITPIYYIFFSVILIPLYALLFGVSTYFTAWLVWLTGKPMGGQGSFNALATAVVWSCAPAILGTFVGLAMSFGGPGLFALGAGDGIISISLYDWLQLILMLWSFKLIIFTVAEAQGFTFWRSVANLSISTLIMLAIVAVPLLLFWVFFGATLMSNLASMLGTLGLD